VVPAEVPEQGARTVVVGDASFAAIDDPVAAPDVLRIGVPVASRSYEVFGLADGAPLGIAELRGERSPERTPANRSQGGRGRGSAAFGRGS